MEIKENPAFDLESLTSVGAMVAQNLIEADPDLKKEEKVRLASLMLRLGYSDDDVLPDLAEEHIRRLDKKIATATKEARSAHWERNADRALQAAHRYLEAQTQGQPITLAAVAEQFGTSERSVFRFVKKLRTARESTNK